MILSIISPVYKGEKMLDELVSRIEKSVQTITSEYEILLVNDSSPDNSWQKIVKICGEDKKVKGINLSRNFGQHYAITAGLSRSKGDWVVVLDCDLQDRPEEIPSLYRMAVDEKFDSVFAQRIDRQDSYLKRLSSGLFHVVFDYFTGIKTDKTVANFGIYNRKVVNAVLSMGDSIRSFPTMVRWVGFRQGYCQVQHAERGEGTSGYNLFKLLKLAENTIINFSNRPLKLVLKFGFVIVVISLMIALFYFVSYMLGYIEVDGFTTIVISLWIIGGLLMFVIGVVGLYICKIFDRVKGRPVFIVSEELNID